MANAAGLLLQEKSESHSWADNISTLSEQSAPVIVPGERSELEEEHSSHHTHSHTHTHCSSQWSTAARGNHEARAREGGSGEHVNAHAREDESPTLNKKLKKCFFEPSYPEKKGLYSCRPPLPKWITVFWLR
ncbi:hypothetical protein SRHO_G00263560 [Serrasalmus rhombeus]